MCGIVGIISKNKIQNPDIAVSMRNVLHHRGPDGAGLWQSPDRRVVLAHQRLAIIDLSPAGHQPMQDSYGQLTIIFNGEIYNYQELRSELFSAGHTFRTQSDTEVILESYRYWGDKCLKHFNGMFSFAIYDSVNDSLFLARDRAGEKPLFYWHNSDTLVFASELKALMKHPEFERVLDLEAMNYYLAYGYIPWDMCILKNVKKLPQGHSMIYNRRENLLTTNRYWKLPSPISQMPIDEQELIQEFEQLLTSSVQKQLKADVPVGILLSGGLDSSLITAVASQISHKPVQTYTITFPGYPEFDEASYARIVANYFGTTHTEFPAMEASVDLLPDLAMQFDEPIADSSMVPTFLVSRLISKHAKVAIGGDGGDELFAGYLHYSWIKRQEIARKLLFSSIRSCLSKIAQNFLPLGFRGRNYILGLKGEIQNSYSFVNHFFDSQTRSRLFLPFIDFSIDSLLSAERFKSMFHIIDNSIIHNAMSIDFMTYLVEDILVKIDRASMLASLEIRSPFLDYRIIEFSHSKVPDNFRINGNDRKLLLRRVAEGLLPKTLDLKQKRGFAIPIAKWFKGEWGDFIKSILISDDSLFNQRMILNLISAQKHGLANTQRLFALVMFELWRKTYGISLN